MPKPFLKYCGGKTKLLSYIKENLPDDYNNYFEPFVGGGSVILNVFDENNKEYYISDINKSLINCYNIVKNSLNELIK
jgi:DNA adenine methylase